MGIDDKATKKPNQTSRGAESVVDGKRVVDNGTKRSSADRFDLDRFLAGDESTSDRPFLAGDESTSDRPPENHSNPKTVRGV